MSDIPHGVCFNLDDPTHAYEPTVLYILECENDSFYVGITHNLERRLQQHYSGKGATHTWRCGAVKVLASRVFKNRWRALSAEKYFQRILKRRGPSDFIPEELSAMVQVYQPQDLWDDWLKKEPWRYFA